MKNIFFDNKHKIKGVSAVLLLMLIVAQMPKAEAISEHELIGEPVLTEARNAENPYEDVLEYTYPDSGTKEDIALFETRSLPSEYDPRDKNTKGIYGWPIQNQGAEGNCWAFAASASGEAWKAKKTGVYPKFSEYHMSAALYRNANNPWTYAHDRNSGGGNREMVAAYYSRGSGPVSSDAFGKQDYDDYYKLESTIENYNAHIKSIDSNEQVTNAIFLNDVNGSYKLAKIDADGNGVYNYYPVLYDGANISVIKQAILNYGAVMTSYCSTENGGLEPNIKREEFFDEDKSSYCFCPSLAEISTITEGKIRQNHAVAIVGWDDDYSWENFPRLPSEIVGLPANKSDMNGAWIVRNSWGAEGCFAAEGGYEYISYYDFFIGAYSATFPGLTEKADYVNQYDGLCPNSSLRWGDEEKTVSSISVKNSFETQNKKAELVRAVGVFVTNANTTIGLRIDNNITANDLNKDAIAPSIKDKPDIEDVVVNDNLVFVRYPGFYMLELEQPVCVNGSYDVILTCSVPRGNINVSVLSENSNLFAAGNVVEQGVSFYFNGRNWQELNKGKFHFTIKTYNDYIENTSAVVSAPVYENEKYTLDVKIVCPDEERFDGKTALVAVYDNSGKLCGVQESVIDLSNGNVHDVKIEYTSAAKYRAMIWDGLGGVMPVWATGKKETIPQ